MTNCYNDCIHCFVCEYVNHDEYQTVQQLKDDCEYCMTAADVAEIKQAYWFFTEYEYFSCSECGESYYNGSDSTTETRERLAEGRYYPYCPHCGAKMKGGVE